MSRTLREQIETIQEKGLSRKELRILKAKRRDEERTRKEKREVFFSPPQVWESGR